MANGFSERIDCLRPEATRIAKPEIIISALHFQWETVEEAFDRCLSDFGLDGIEFSYPHPRFGPQQLDEARELSEETGLRINGHFWGNLARGDANDATACLHRWLHTAVKAGFDQIICHGGSCRQHWTGVETVCEGIREVMKEFQQHGITLALENHYPFTYNRRWELFSSPQEFTHLAATVQSDALGFCIDYGHSRMNDCTDALLEAIGPRLVNAHIADNMGVHDDHLPFGEGCIQWEDVLTKTFEVGFRGPFTLEFPLEKRREPVAECVRAIQDLYGG